MSETRVTRILEKPYRVEVSKTSRGQYSWSVKVAGDTPEECLQELERLIAEVDRRCGEAWRIEEAPPPAEPAKAEKISLEEAVETLPWKPYPKGGGAWVFSDLAEHNPTASRLKQAIENSPNKQLNLGPYVYRITGEGKFIGRSLKPT